jgi:hypothetical protein
MCLDYHMEWGARSNLHIIITFPGYSLWNFVVSGLNWPQSYISSFCNYCHHGRFSQCVRVSGYVFELCLWVLADIQLQFGSACSGHCFASVALFVNFPSLNGSLFSRRRHVFCANGYFCGRTNMIIMSKGSATNQEASPLTIATYRKTISEVWLSQLKGYLQQIWEVDHECGWKYFFRR